MRRRLLVLGTVMAVIGSLVSAATPAPPILRLPENPVVEAENASGASVTYTVKANDDGGGGPLTAACDYPPGSQAEEELTVTANFPLGQTTVTCTATDGTGTTLATDSFVVTVRDTTPPVVTGVADVSATTTDPAGVTVSFPAPSATDAVDGSVAATCDHVSGALYPVGATLVTCSATDSRGNTGTASFTVTVSIVDTTPPVVTVSGDTSVTTENPAGANVSFAASATDNIDGSLTPTCSPPSGGLFAVGTTGVTCTATDSHGNSGSASLTVTVVLVDTTAPSLSVPADMIVEVENPAGANVTYSVSATDNVDGALTPACDHPSGALFPVGSTAVSCTATDSHGNTGSATFTVRVDLVDRTAPSFSGVPANMTIEANGPGGSVVVYEPPLAVDAIDGPIAQVTCAPASKANFPLGTTTVKCEASDAHGNTVTASFTITVRDTTPPVLRAPVEITLDATAPDGLPASDPALAAFLGSANASDIVDPAPTVVHDAPSFFPVGATGVRFTARDHVGNASSATATVTIRPKPLPGTPSRPAPPPPDLTPPADVANLKAAAGPGSVRLTWKPPSDNDFDHVSVVRSDAAEGGPQREVYEGKGTVVTDRSVRNGVTYRYVVTSYDGSGNRSAGVAIVATPKRVLLLAPPNGARVRKPPVLRWAAVARAGYYNVQLFRGSEKVLSAWPRKTTLSLTRSWKYRGRSYRLTRGLYRWYVWPGFGAAKAARYGEPLGESTFQMG